MSQRLNLIIDETIATLTLNHAERRNAVTQDMWAAIPDLISQAEEMPGVRTLILHGGECGHFAAGADISEFSTHYTTPENIDSSIEALSRASDAIAALSKPVIAAIEGSCMGAGLSLATAADLRVVADGARFCLPPAKLGVAYPYNDLRRMVDLIGHGMVRDLLLTARVFGADEAAQMGLSSRRVEAGVALSSAQTIAADMAKLSPWSQMAGKQMLSNIAAGVATETADMRQLQINGFLGNDFQEGHRAFLEKRKPDFSKP